MLVSCFCSSRDFALDLGPVDARLAGGNQLGLDLVDDVDGAVHGGVGDVDHAAPRPSASCTVDSAALSERIVVAIDQ